MSHILSIVSGKGGVGKSAVSVFLGTALAKMGKKVLLMETDIGLRGLDIMLGLENKTVFDISDVLLSRCEPSKAIVESETIPNLFLLPACASPDYRLDKQDFCVFTKNLAPYYDFIIIDSCAGFSSNFFASIAPADSAFIVVTPDPICIRDARIVADKLYQSKIPAVKLVINKVPKSFSKHSVVPNLDIIIDIVGAQLIGVIPEDTQVLRCLSNGLQLQEHTEIKIVFDNIANRVLGNYVKLQVG